MESLHLDTSVLVRLLVQAPADLYRRAADFLEEKIASQASVSVGDLALAEAFFALQSFYQIPKASALELISGFIHTEGIAASSSARAILVEPNLATAEPGFVDRLIHGASRAAEATLVTFEKSAAKLPDTIVLAIHAA